MDRSTDMADPDTGRNIRSPGGGRQRIDRAGSRTGSGESHTGAKEF
jgi:hypothetical protein